MTKTHTHTCPDVTLLRAEGRVLEEWSSASVLQKADAALPPPLPPAEA